MTNPSNQTGPSTTGEMPVIDDDMLDRVTLEESGETPTDSAAARKRARQEERKKNLKHTFGSGPGKIALIACGLIVVLFVALGSRMLNRAPEVAPKASTINVPKAPKAGLSTEVSAREAARHDEVAGAEADAAASSGKTYQPGFEPDVAKKADAGDETAAFNVPNAPDRQKSPWPNPNGAGRPGPNGPNTYASGGGAPGGSTYAPTAPASGTAAQDQQRLQQEYQTALRERETYVKGVRDAAFKSVERFISAGTGNEGRYTTISYAAVRSAVGQGGQTGAAVGGGAAMASNAAPADSKEEALSIGNPKNRMLIKTGNILHITSVSKVNTDDAMTILAQVDGGLDGVWNGAQLIGRLEKGQDNITAHFTTLAPQDKRPTMRINAIALREEDAAQGIAENIDRHILSRYGSLAAASLLSGFGRAYQNVGSTVITGGGTAITTYPEPSDKQIIANALGTMGTNLGGEVMKNFNRPDTYSTPAQQGFALYFLQDVYQQNQ